jgi:hypothetical protein
VIERVQPSEGGAKATAPQTLSRLAAFPNLAKRLDCGAFTAAFPGARLRQSPAAARSQTNAAKYF